MTRSFASVSLVKSSSIALLVVVWCVLWGEATIANVVSGIVFATAFVVLGTLRTPARSVRLLPLLRFFGLVAVDLGKSTVAVAVEVLTPTDRTDEAITVVDLRPDALAHPLLMVVAVTITPGTGVVDVDLATGRVYLHLLHARRADEVDRHVRTLNRLANAALPLRSPASSEHDTVDHRGVAALDREDVDR